MNPVTGEKVIDIGGRKCILKFTWRALVEIEQKYGDNPKLFNPDVVANVVAAGLRDRYPDMTADKIMEISPPLVPFANAVQEAIKWAYFGAEEIPKKEDVKKNGRLKDGLSRLIGRLFNAGSAPRNSGG